MNNIKWVNCNFCELFCSSFKSPYFFPWLKVWSVSDLLLELNHLHQVLCSRWEARPHLVHQTLDLLHVDAGGAQGRSLKSTKTHDDTTNQNAVSASQREKLRETQHDSLIKYFLHWWKVLMMKWSSLWLHRWRKDSPGSSVFCRKVLCLNCEQRQEKTKESIYFLKNFKEDMKIKDTFIKFSHLHHFIHQGSIRNLRISFFSFRKNRS